MADDQPGAGSPGDENAAGYDEKLFEQEDIEKMLEQAGKEPEDPAQQPAGESLTDTNAVADTLPEADTDYLLKQAERAIASINSDSGKQLPQGISSFQLEEFSGAPPSTENTTLGLVRDVELDLKIELGRTHMYLEDVLRLRKGSVVPLDKLAGDPVDVYVNGRLVARGEVLVLNDNFCVRVAELIAGSSAAG